MSAQDQLTFERHQTRALRQAGVLVDGGTTAAIEAVWAQFSELWSRRLCRTSQ